MKSIVSAGLFCFVTIGILSLPSGAEATTVGRDVVGKLSITSSQKANPSIAAMASAPSAPSIIGTWVAHENDGPEGGLWTNVLTITQDADCSKPIGSALETAQFDFPDGIGIVSFAYAVTCKAVNATSAHGSVKKFTSSKVVQNTSPTANITGLTSPDYPGDISLDAPSNLTFHSVTPMRYSRAH